MTLTLMKRRCHGQKFDGQTYTNLDLSNMLAFGSTWTGILFKGCDLSQADFTTAKLLDCHFYQCDLSLARFNASEMRHVVFENCKGKGASFGGVTPMADVKFMDCQLHYSSFFDSTAKDVRFIGSNLHGADLRFIDGGATAIFQDCVLWNASVQLGCQFFSAQFDKRSADLFTGMVARRHPDPESASRLAEIAGGQMAVVDRLMNNREAAEVLEKSSVEEVRERLANLDIDKHLKAIRDGGEYNAALGEFPGC